jgi:hypothetical protein
MTSAGPRDAHRSPWRCSAPASVGAQAAQVLLNAQADTTLFEDAVQNSSGVGSFLFVGSIASGSPRRALIRFDLSSIPTGSTIDWVGLRFVVNRAGIGSSADDRVSLHALAAPWEEGTSDGGSGGAQATATDATWKFRIFGTPSVSGSQVEWLTPGGDFDPVASASVNVPGVGAYGVESTAALVADVQTWLDDPATNFGWILLGPEPTIDDPSAQNAKRILSRSSPATADTPLLLTVNYTPVPLPAAAWLLAPAVIGLGGLPRRVDQTPQAAS